MSDGKRLLELYREEQKKRNHPNYKGCMCDDCIEDMSNALKKI